MSEVEVLRQLLTKPSANRTYRTSYSWQPLVQSFQLKAIEPELEETTDTLLGESQVSVKSLEKPNVNVRVNNTNAIIFFITQIILGHTWPSPLDFQ